MTAATSVPWLENLSPECAAYVRAIVATSVPLTNAQRDRIAALLRNGA